jgi:hypothetical protein
VYRKIAAPRQKADARIRTGDPFITSEVLYQLSYVGGLAAASLAPVDGRDPAPLGRPGTPRAGVVGGVGNFHPVARKIPQLRADERTPGAAQSRTARLGTDRPL